MENRIENKQDYEISELYEMLKNDETWEPDPEQRAMLAMMLQIYIASL